jgi:hypothetical protein
VAVVGDGTREAFRDGLAKAGCAASCSKSEHAEDRAVLIASADVCVVVVDSTWGPKPIHREDVLLARQFCRGPVCVGFSKTNMIDAPDLLAVEELEMRELLKTYDLPGGSALVFFDSPRAVTRLPRGFGSAAGALATVRPAKSRSTMAPSRAVLRAFVYNLTPEEAFSRGLVGLLKTGQCSLVFAKGRYDALVKCDTPIKPGEFGPATVVLKRATDIGERGRFVIVKHHHVVAAGSLLKE